MSFRIANFSLLILQFTFPYAEIAPAYPEFMVCARKRMKPPDRTTDRNV